VDYFGFRRSLESQISKLKLPDDCTLQEPSWEITAPPFFWTVEFFFNFVDKQHIRIWESYEKVAGLQMSRRLQWAYHYGIITATDGNGNTMQGSPDDPFEIRIDTCSGLHLHHQRREPHYGQGRVNKLDLKTVDTLTFVNAVFKRRKSGQPFTKTLGFTVT
jgi:hypothetical protein